MQEETKPAESLSSEIQEVMRALIAAIRAVKLYPPNNPVYSQSVKKAHEAIGRFLALSPEYTVGVQKTYFTYQRTPLGKDGQLNKAIAQDLFAKGIREIVFSFGVAETELLDLCRAFALSHEELAMRSGISSILWEKNAEHIKVTEAGLDEVISTKTEGGWEDKTPEKKSGEGADPAALKKAIEPGKTLVLGDLMTDPAGFGASMMELAKQTRAAHESVEDRLYALYREAGQKIQKEQPGEAETLFEGLAKSVLALDPRYRDGFIAGKLYGDLDVELAAEQAADGDAQLPTAMQEIQTGRFSETWNVKQVATLLKKASSKKAASPSKPPVPSELTPTPFSPDLAGIAKELAEYNSDEMASLKAFSEAGMESDIIEASVRTLIHLIPLVKNPLAPGPAEKELDRFSAVIGQLEDLMNYLLKNKQYDLATIITHAFHQPVAPEFRPRMEEAKKKTASRSMIIAAISDLRTHHKDSPEYHAAYAYLSISERGTTQILLDLLAEEQDRTVRLTLLDLAKNFGKNQIDLLGEHIADDRWYFVRNIVNILGEMGTDQALALLRKAADHNNLRIRQEVVKGLLTIGGKKAASVLAKFLRDRDADMQLTAIHAFGDMTGIGAEESVPLITFLEERQLTKKDQAFTLEAIKTLGKIGGRTAADFLKGYNSIRWWKSRKLQAELRDAARHSLEEIARRRSDGGRAKR